MLISSREELWPVIAYKTLKSSSAFGVVPKVAAKHFLRLLM